MEQSTNNRTCIPGGIELLLKKAVVDKTFRSLLLSKRSKATDAMGIVLTDSESSMLDLIPEAQLSTIISHTKVNPVWRQGLLGCTTAVVLAALGSTNLALGDDQVPSTKEYSSIVTDKESERQINGILTGFVKDKDGKGIYMVEIAICGLRLGDLSDKDGNYVITKIPEGTYDIVFARSGYKDKIIKRIKIKASKVKDLNVVMVPGKPPKYQIGGIRP